MRKNAPCLCVKLMVRFRRKHNLLSAKAILPFGESSTSFRRKQYFLSAKGDYQPNARAIINLTRGLPST
ncbi:MAG: hypothetical protein IJ269_07715 [Bacteroidales bacterium]|nr:hypothetical protein [Bacteroidales bacterium]